MERAVASFVDNFHLCTAVRMPYWIVVSFAFFSDDRLSAMDRVS
jgi:hypothetical protein